MINNSIAFEHRKPQSRTPSRRLAHSSWDIQMALLADFTHLESDSTRVNYVPQVLIAKKTPN